MSGAWRQLIAGYLGRMRAERLIRERKGQGHVLGAAAAGAAAEELVGGAALHQPVAGAGAGSGSGAPAARAGSGAGAGAGAGSGAGAAAREQAGGDDEEIDDAAILANVAHTCNFKDLQDPSGAWFKRCTCGKVRE
jgi:hypothetical protein